jgi:hypothetical protein
VLGKPFVHFQENPMTRTLGFAFLSLFATHAALAADKAHANFDHPAVATARLAQQDRVDANRFLVQPPASVTWTVQPEAKLLAAATPVVAK